MNGRIKMVREHFGLNQTEFGNRIGIKQSTVATNENGSRAISERTIASICREFNVSRHWLETGEGSMFIQSGDDFSLEQILRSSQNSPALRSLLTAWSKLNEKNQEIFLGFVESFVENYQANSEDE